MNISNGKLLFKIVEGKNLIEGLLKLKPDDRFSIAEILSHPWFSQDDNKYFSEIELTNDEFTEEPNIDKLNIKRLFSKDRTSKLSYSDFCAIKGEFCNQWFNENALDEIEKIGYTKSLVVDSMSKGELNHAVAAYNLWRDRKSVV